MDGGALALNDKSSETVWRRNLPFINREGKEERKWRGQGCTMESVNGKNVFAWTNNGDVII
jgi:hypothetical protein